MLEFFVAASQSQIEEFRLQPRLSVGGPVYWYLHRYFVQADLNPGTFSFLNLYEDTEISGYQLHRLKTELSEALADLASKPAQFPVLVGWLGETKSKESEEWKNLQAAEVNQKIQQLLALVSEAQEHGYALFAIGD